MTTRERLEERLDQMTREVRETGRKAWLVSLGAVGRVDEQARELFADWAARGEKLDVEPGEVKAPWNAANARAKAFSEKVETQLEHSVCRTLHRFGIPARDDIRQLSDRIEQLSRKVEGLVA